MPTHEYRRHHPDGLDGLRHHGAVGDDAPTRVRRAGTRAAAVVLACAWAALLAGVVAVRGGAPLDADVAVRDLVFAGGSGPGVRVAAAVTQLGAGPVLYPVLLLLCLWGMRGPAGRRSSRELLPVLALAAGQVLELVVFATLRRPVPFDGASGLLSTTFSSGHSAAAVLGWGLIAWQAARLRSPAVPPPRRMLWAFALAVGATVAVTRVYLGVHWVSDAVAGVIVGAALLALVLAALERLEPPTAPAPTPAPSPVPVPLPEPELAPAREPGLLAWARTSPWAWSLPVAAALVPIGALLAAPADERLKDLLVYHGAGGTAGAGENLYAFRTSFAMPFTYPPFAALVIEPLSRMPLGLAQALWTVATLAAVVALAPTALRPVVDRIGLPVTVACLLVSGPVRSHLRFGQVGVFLVLLVALDLLGRHAEPGRRDGGRFVGWGLGLATAIKLTPAVFLPWLLVTRQWRRLAGTLAWIVGATLAGLALLWPSSGDYVFRASRDTSRFGNNEWPGNQSVRGMLLRVLPDPTAEWLWLVAALVLAAVGTYQAWRCERRGDRLAAVGVLAALSVAVSPISWVHHLVWLALPIGALAAAGRFRLVAAWFAILVVSFPGLGRAVGVPVLSDLIIDVQGLTAVAAVLLLPRLVLDRSRR
jgi:alpha-1,2-mannosyltransferase